jgi:hypothetical protein
MDEKNGRFILVGLGLQQKSYIHTKEVWSSWSIWTIEKGKNEVMKTEGVFPVYCMVNGAITISGMFYMVKQAKKRIGKHNKSMDLTEIAGAISADHLYVRLHPLRDNKKTKQKRQ